MEIRRIEERDVDQFLNLWDLVYDEGQFLEQPSPPRARFERVVARVVEDQIPNFVLLDGDTLVGALEVFPATYFDFQIPDAQVLGVLGMQIHKDYRSQGYGRRLMEIALVGSAEYGIERIELDVLQSNVTAISLYEKFGFRKTQDGREVKLPTGQITHFQKMLLETIPTRVPLDTEPLLKQFTQYFERPTEQEEFETVVSNS
jgi:ribosomal protein S18 acetylase RimI-like enzyme